MMPAVMAPPAWQPPLTESGRPFNSLMARALITRLPRRHPSATLYLIFRACRPRGPATCVHGHSQERQIPHQAACLPGSGGCTPHRQSHALQHTPSHPPHGTCRYRAAKVCPPGNASEHNSQPPQADPCAQLTNTAAWLTAYPLVECIVRSHGILQPPVAQQPVKRRYGNAEPRLLKLPLPQRPKPAGAPHKHSALLAA